MMEFEKIDIHSLEMNPFTKIGQEWMLITAGNGQNVNTMTASWGGMGVLWGSDVAMAFIRPQRYTREFVDASDRFTLSFFEKDKRPALQLLGTKSGRDGDKIAQAGLHVREFDGAPAFEEASLVLVTRKLYREPLKGESFLDAQVRDKNYPQKDYHILYVAAIEGAYRLKK